MATFAARRRRPNLLRRLKDGNIEDIECVRGVWVQGCHSDVVFTQELKRLEPQMYVIMVEKQHTGVAVTGVRLVQAEPCPRVK